MKLAKTVLPSPILRSIAFYLITKNAGEEISDVFYTKNDHMEKFIKQCIPSDHPAFEKACELFSKYLKTKKSEHLLRLYTLETPFYHNLSTNRIGVYLLVAILMKNNDLKVRAYSGRTYRGLSMKKAALKAYRSGFKRKGSVLLIQTFCSTSVDETVARQFIRDTANEKVRVLMIFDFPKLCDMAIQLYALSKELPCLSDYEYEKEVLVLPFAIFHVINITEDDPGNQFTIYLENVLPKWDLKTLWNTYRDLESNVLPFIAIKRTHSKTKRNIHLLEIADKLSKY